TPCETEREHLESLRRRRAAIQPPEDDERHERERAEDDARCRAERHAEGGAGIVRQRETRNVADDTVRHVRRKEIAFRKELRDVVEDDHAGGRTPEDAAVRAETSQ